jgi:tetratricopeptide (TPR) repeat protein
LPEANQIVAAQRDYQLTILHSAGAVGRLAVQTICGFTLALSLSAANATSVQQAKKTYVPATQIDRRLDFTALQDKPAVLDLNSRAKYTRLAGRINNNPNAKAVAQKLSSNSMVALRQKATNLIKQGRLNEAEALLKSAYQKSDANEMLASALSKVNLEKAQSLFNAKNIESAVTYARQALYYNPANGAASKLLDDLHTKLGTDPKDLNARLKIADQLASNRNIQAAIVEYRSAQKIKPSAWAHTGLGNLALVSNQPKIAKEEFEKAVSTDPNAAYAHRQLGLLKLSSGDVVGANTDLGRAVLLDPKDQMASQAYVNLWQRQVSAAPNDANNHMGLARAYQLTGDLPSAQAAYQQAVHLNPNHPNLPAARESFKRASHKQAVQSHLNQAHSLELQGALPEAEQHVRDAIKHHPGDANIRLYDALLLEKMGQTVPAYNAHMSVLHLAPNNATAAEHAQLLATSLPTAADAVATDAGSADVAQLSGFTGSLRNHMLTEQKRLEGVEQATRQVVHSIAKNSVGGLPTLGSPGESVMPSVLASKLTGGVDPVPIASSPPTTSYRPPILHSTPAAMPPRAPSLTKSTPAFLPTQLSAPPTIPQALSSSPVRFELEGVKPSTRDVELKVVIRNDQDTSMTISRHPRVAIRTGNNNSTARASFSDISIPAHGEVHGTINVPSRQLNASSDIALKDFSTASGSQDIHLTTPISWRQ